MSPIASSSSMGRTRGHRVRFAANCLLARRLAERDVRFIQLYHPGWDHHGGLPGGIRQQCRETDQACAALIRDLKQRGMLDDTLVLWGGEFGRTNYSQGKLTATDYGRDHTEVREEWTGVAGFYRNALGQSNRLRFQDGFGEYRSRQPVSSAWRIGPQSRPNAT